MKIQSISLYLLISIAIFLSACTKEESTENSFLAPASLISDSIYLDKIYDKYDPTLPDTNEIITFHYDASKRVVSINDSIYNGTTLDYVAALNYYYAGADTLPVKILEISDNTLANDTMTTFVTYDAARRKVRDSVLYNYYLSGSPIKYKTIISYSFAPGYVYGETVISQITLPTIVSVTRDTAVMDSPGNIISNKKYELVGTAFSLFKTATFAYDNKRDPVSLLTMHRSGFSFPNGATQYFEYLGFNNIVVQHETTQGGVDYDEFSAYVYNTRGLPVKRTLSNGGVNEVYIFKYKSL